MARRREGSQELDRRAQFAVLVALAIVCAIGAFRYFDSHRPGQNATDSATLPRPSVIVSADMLLGNPSGASADPSNRTNYLMVKPFYALAYNDELGTAKWVSWRVTAADLGNAPRKPAFDPDDSLPPGFYRVTHKDYSASGFDRGHLCPHSDRAATSEMSFATFIMTNIIPQAPNLNEKTWAQLETYCRDLVRRHQRLYITAGPAGRGGSGSNGTRERIAGGRVTVPAECWKIVVCIPEEGGDDDRAKINPATRVITVIMPNDNAVEDDWTKYRTSAANVESKTGLRFFDRLDPTLAQTLRDKVDNATITPARRNNYGGG